MSGSTYQEEHPLLVAFPGQFLKTALSDELPVVLDEVLVTHQITLQLHQLDQVFLGVNYITIKLWAGL